MIHIQRISGGYGKEPIVKDISFHVNAGEIFSIVGPNGSGKSTLLKFIYGALEPMTGEVNIDQRSLSSYSQKELARKIAVLPQHTETAFSFTVREVVELGRYPHQKGWFSTNTKNDEDMVQHAMKDTGVEAFAHLPMDMLSGGEKQRVLLARALAQEADILLLDEPTNHLDISFQISLLDTLKKWTLDKKLTVVAVLHDLNMAAMYSDRVLLLKDGTEQAIDKPAYVMEKEKLEDVYHTQLYRREHPSVPSPLISLVPSENDHSFTSDAIDQLSIHENKDHTLISSPDYWKTLSSAVIGAGFGWHRLFINRHVDKSYYAEHPEEEFSHYLQTQQLDVADTAGMMTAARLEDGAAARLTDAEGDVFVYATAGVANAVDASRAYKKSSSPVSVGTINIWIFIHGTLTEAAYAQLMMTATEAKVKALFDKNIKDPDTETTATGTSTDSVLIAASQQGSKYDYGGTISVLGKKTAKAVYDAVCQTLDNYICRK
ncbi:heme ABC transporter ATP-binding protein [Alteribacillus iranensis]|uniref:Iron complex transport system ATP-binding protein n=1 Tax=Alteribacillus iranensis TaxID=930128 RepID=A0A1I1ZRH1_9BACI|nr:heme ABC transporter ATP-binding protein [Alteribacillus iranensis]SFE33010.1 iron complex transport system ATP-binding protein [Alteribacillus iranensis]